MWERKYQNTLSNNPENRAIYGIRRKMIERCTDKDSPRYKDYGGRGISICEEWLNDYDAFADWAKASGYAKGLSIDRIDNNGDYTPDNCRWVSEKQQNRNKRNTFTVEYRGDVKPLKTWCEELGLKYDTMHHRLTHGWSPEEAFNTSTARKSFASVCREHGLKPQLVYDRVHTLGWSMEEALNTPSLGLGGHRERKRKKSAG